MPMLLRDLIVFFDVDVKSVPYYSLAAFAFFSGGAVALRNVSESYLLKIRARVESHSRKRMARALLDTEWAAFLSLRMGDVSNAVVIEGMQMATGLTFFIQSVSSMVIVTGLLGCAFLVSFEMTLYTTLFGLAGLPVFVWAIGKTRQHSKTLSDTLANINNCTADIFGNIKFFKASGLTKDVDLAVSTAFDDYGNAFFRTNIFSFVMRFAVECGGVVFISAFLLACLTFDDVSLASGLIFLAIFYRIIPRVLTVQQNLYLAQSYLPWYETWAKRLEFLQANRAGVGGQVPPVFDSKIKLNQLTFCYPGAKQPALQDISFTVEKGDCIAIVGASGSGKSTLVDVLCGLLTSYEGKMTLDGVDFRHVRLDGWQRKIGLVMQEAPLFHASIAQNISWGDKVPDMGRVRQAAMQAYATEFIDDIPGGFDAQVGEKGARLSGGQRQRIALARAIYRRPWLLILDEATSALDGESEKRIQDTLTAEKGKRTILMVAHRLKTVRMADFIYVMSGGRIIESGSWEELISKENGVFGEMVSMQKLESADEDVVHCGDMLRESS
jgi:ABC-type multidrug transport system fused ATPase/permease subunit